MDDIDLHVETAVESGKLLGIHVTAGSVGRMSVSTSGKEWQMNHVEVAEDHRRKGIAGAMLDALLERLPADGLPCLATVVEDYDPAQALYASKGFVVVPGSRDGHNFTMRREPSVASV